MTVSDDDKRPSHEMFWAMSLVVLILLGSRFPRTSSVSLIALFATYNSNTLQNLGKTYVRSGRVAARAAAASKGSDDEPETSDPASESTPAPTEGKGDDPPPPEAETEAAEDRMTRNTPYSSSSATSVPQSGRDLETLRQEYMDTRAQTFKTHNPSSTSMSRLLDAAYDDLMRHGIRRDVHMVAESDDADSHECARLPHKD